MSLFRTAPVRVYYGENRSAYSWDEYVTATAVAAGMLGLAWFCILPTFKWKNEKRQAALANTSFVMAVFVFVVAILGLTCKSWQYGEVHTLAQYAPYSNSEVNGTIGLYVGLQSFNVTLVGNPEFQNTTSDPNTIEQINYNEVVDFGVRQGRNGYSEYANKVNQEYRQLQARGVPYPITSVIEVFTNDGDGLRWGRTYRKAGYYAHILLWTSVPLWTLTLAAIAVGLWGLKAGFVNESSINTGRYQPQQQQLSRKFLLQAQLRPGAILCTITGVFLLAAPIVYALVLTANLSPVAIHFRAKDLQLTFGWTFYLTLVTGAVVSIMGASAYIWCISQPGMMDFDFIWGKATASILESDRSPSPESVVLKQREMIPLPTSALHNNKHVSYAVKRTTYDNEREALSSSQQTSKAASPDPIPQEPVPQNQSQLSSETPPKTSEVRGDGDVDPAQYEPRHSAAPTPINGSSEMRKPESREVSMIEPNFHDE